MLLFLYSYTQVDLDLTFSRLGFLHSLVKSFQYIGWFQRPLSTIFYLIIVFIFFMYYGFFLGKSVKEKISRREVWTVIIVISVILLFSYNAFSYDLFNYIFDARILTHYHQNPFVHKALDYPHDPMLTFMRWTHRSYPYGPFWLVLTVPLSFIGFGFFIPTFLLFKALMAGSFLGTTYTIEKLYKKITKKDSVSALVFFALNPLVIIECLVSAHNDIVMMFLALVSLLLYIDKHYAKVILVLFFSIAVKFGTMFMIPVYVVTNFFRIQKHLISGDKIVLLVILSMTVATLLVSFRTIYEPWYLLWVLPFCSVLKDKYYIFLPSTIFSFFSLLYYAPFLYTGNWNEPVHSIIILLMAISVIISGITVGVVALRIQIYKKAVKMIQ